MVNRNLTNLPKKTDFKRVAKKKTEKASPPAIAQQPSAVLDPFVGLVVSIYWDSESAWYDGVVVDFNADNGRHCIMYDCPTSFTAPPDISWSDSLYLLDQSKRKLFGRASHGQMTRLAAFMTSTNGDADPLRALTLDQLYVKCDAAKSEEAVVALQAEVADRVAIMKARLPQYDSDDEDE